MLPLQPGETNSIDEGPQRKMNRWRPPAPPLSILNRLMFTSVLIF